MTGPDCVVMCNLINTHTHTHIKHVLRTHPQTNTQTMNAMKLKNVVPLPLEFNEYAEATLDTLGEEACMTPTKLFKHLQNVCIVYACLAVKRNAGIVSTEAIHAAAAKGYNRRTSLSQATVQGVLVWTNFVESILRRFFLSVRRKFCRAK